MTVAPRSFQSCLQQRIESAALAGNLEKGVLLFRPWSRLTVTSVNDVYISSDLHSLKETYSSLNPRSQSPLVLIDQISAGAPSFYRHALNGAGLAWGLYESQMTWARCSLLLASSVTFRKSVFCSFIVSSISRNNTLKWRSFISAGPALTFHECWTFNEWENEWRHD